jgi:hypothetical protein
MNTPKHITPETISAVRRLDIAFVNKVMEADRGYPFVDGPSDVNGRWYTADENALVALHKLRTKLGTKKQARESTGWLRSQGLLGLFEQPLDLN